VGMHRFIIEGTEYEVAVGGRDGNLLPVTVNGKEYTVELAAGAAPNTVAASQPASKPARSPARPAGARQAAGAGGITAPISGVVLRVAVEPGQSVKTGTLLIVLEAMKMENEIFAPMDGVITTVTAKPQQEVSQGDPLLVITPA